MRFIAEGPSIPDELLIARDEGRVVFFCGAGVSRAKVNLPDFFGLAQRVTNKLGVPLDDPAIRLLTEAQEIGDRIGIDGVISADRIFGLLERGFLSRDVEHAVASSLQPGETPNIEAHRTLVRLARTREGLVRLVTTNFDRLFDLCDPSLPTFQPPKLPDPTRPSDFHGVVYLHGKATKDYDGAEGDGFILSSSGFGRAYLSDGWATAFVRDVIERYVVVFVGYAADDPPVQYLLEALNKTHGRLDGVYAFQSGEPTAASAKWEHRGVEAIPYNEKEGHAALWQTLEAWAERADDPEKWVHDVVERAKAGPENLEPFERGQVAHIASTTDGMRVFSDGDNPPSASWLYVFDPLQRYSQPGRQGGYTGDGPYVDPFTLFGLDTDIVPPQLDPEDDYAKREVPQTAWDAFNANRRDRFRSTDDNFGAFRGHWAENVSPLPSRLSTMATWIGKVAHRAETVWWAVRQTALHPEIRQQIAWRLERTENIDLAITKSWRYLIEQWLDPDESEFRDWYELGREIGAYGWDRISLRKFVELSRPKLRIKPNTWGGPIPPKYEKETEFGELVSSDVSYPDLPTDLDIPRVWLPAVVENLRRNLEIAVDLEIEIGGFGLGNISPLSPDESIQGDAYGRTHGLSGWVHYYATLFDRLINEDIEAAKHEYSTWRSDDQSVFARLKIWGIGKPELVAAADIPLVLDAISNDVFWDSDDTRDLLLALSVRWNDLDFTAREEIERRLLNGPDQWKGEDDDKFAKRKSWSILNRLHWLAQHGCELTLDIDEVTAKLTKQVPDWQPDHAKSAARSFEGQVGWVKTETEYGSLAQEPLSTILAKAAELSGREGMAFVRHDPFAGLSESRPIRSFAALRLAAKGGEYPEWAWHTFLNPERRKNDKPSFTAFIGENLLRYANAHIAGFVRSAADWFQKSAKVLTEHYPDLFSRLMQKFTAVLAEHPESGSSGILRGKKEPDWATEAINSPTGDLAEALFDDPQKNGLKIGQGLPQKWLAHIEALLALPGDLRRHALVIFGHQLSWFFAIDPQWTTKNLLSAMDVDKYDEQALWSGLLWGGNLHGFELFTILKPKLLELAKSGQLDRRGHTEAIAGLVYTAWALIDDKTGERWVSDDELRNVLLNANDDFRSRVLWRAEQWSKRNEATEEDESATRQHDATALIELLRDVWPRQIAAKTPNISARLCDLAFSNEDQFPELAQAVLPLITKADKGYLPLPNLRRSRDSIVDRYPELTLAILYAVLPDNVSAWPHGIDQTLNRIGEAESALNADERLLELNRKWNSR